MTVEFYRCDHCGLVARSVHALSGEKHLLFRTLEEAEVPEPHKKSALVVHASTCGTFVRAGERSG